jgi:hypothetical protein
MRKHSELSNTKGPRNSEIMSPPLHNYHRLLHFLRTGLPKVPGDAGCNGKVRLGVRRHFKGMQQTLHLIELYLKPTRLLQPAASDELLYKCLSPWLSPRDLTISLVLLSLCHLKKDMSL